METKTIEIFSNRLESLERTLSGALDEAVLLGGQDGMADYIDDLSYLHALIQEKVQELNSNDSQASP